MYMKQFMLYCCAFITGSTVSAQTIDGCFEEKVSKGQMYLYHYPDIMGYRHEDMKIDSAPIINGHFHFDFHPGAEPRYAKLIHANREERTNKMTYYGEVNLFLTEDSILVYTKDSLKNTRIFNSAANYDFAVLKERVEPATRIVNLLHDQIYVQDAKTVPAKVLSSPEYQRFTGKRMQLANEERSAAYAFFIQQNPYSWVSLHALQKYIGQGNQNRISQAIATLYNNLGRKLKQSETGVAIRKRIEAKSKLYIGSKAPGFQLPDANGKKVSLAAYRGKYVLLEFWSSSCGACRNEAPHLKKAFELYQRKGFDILSVSLDDQKYEHRNGGRSAWLKAIKEDGTGKWRQLSDLKGWKSAPAVLYDIQAIPQNYLIDPDGVIISENLRGADLFDKLEELFK